MALQTSRKVSMQKIKFTIREIDYGAGQVRIDVTEDNNDPVETFVPIPTLQSKKLQNAEIVNHVKHYLKFAPQFVDNIAIEDVDHTGVIDFPFEEKATILLPSQFSNFRVQKLEDYEV